MIIIAFATGTSKIIPRLVCRHLRHCAVIVPHGDILVMYQFTRPGQMARIRLTPRDIRVLGRHGWRFIYVDATAPRDFAQGRIYTCVHLAKRALRLNTWRIQTPYALYKHMRRPL